MNNNLDKQYISLVKDILNYGVKKQTRSGEVLSVFGRQIRHSMSEGFPILTSKHVSLKNVATELIWMLRAKTNIKYLVDNDCDIWVGDSYRNYLDKVMNDGVNYIHDVEEYDEQSLDDGTDWPIVTPYTKEQFIEKIKTDDEFAKKWGELGPIYGKQWRRWESEIGENLVRGITGDWIKTDPCKISTDQIANLISELKTNPDSRRLMVNAWNVGELNNMVLPPCHYGFQVYTRELTLKERIDYGTKINMWRLGQTISYLHCDKMNIPTRAISLKWDQRSMDVGLGASYNIASYSLLLHIIAKQVNMIPDEVIGSIGDCHIYLNQVEGIKEQLEREPYDLPKLIIKDKQVNDIGEYDPSDFSLDNYQYHPAIKLPLSN